MKMNQDRRVDSDQSICITDCLFSSFPIGSSLERSAPGFFSAYLAWYVRPVDNSIISERIQQILTEYGDGYRQNWAVSNLWSTIG
jgi:hypothetical protein